MTPRADSYVMRAASTLTAVPNAFDDDEILVKGLVARDADAFAYLLDRYHAPLHRPACQYVPTAAVADEVVQETWLAVITGIDRFEQRSSVKTWLFRILLNVARSHGVREHRSIPFAPTLGDDEPAVDPKRFRRFTLHGRGAWKHPPHAWPEPEQAALDAETRATIDHAVSHLPPAQRDVVTMRDLLGWSAPEVCDALELTEANQRVLLHRARSKIRRALEQHYDESGTR